MKVKLYISIFIFLLASVNLFANCDSIQAKKISFELRTFDQAKIDNYKSDSTYDYINIHKDELSFFEKLRNKFFAWILDREVLNTDIPDFTKFIVYVIAFAFGAVLLFLIYKLGYINFFQKEEKADDDILLEEIDRDTNIATIDELIRNAKINEDYRLVTRLLYLKSLKKLTDNSLIDWRKGKTNADYVTELKKSKLHDDFKQLTAVFEYVWYGEFQIETADSINEIENRFEDFFTKINAN